MAGGYPLLPGQVRYGASQFQDAVEGPGAHLELIHGRAQEAPTRLIEGTILAYLRWPHVGVAGEASPGEASTLPLPGYLHPSPDRLRVLQRRIAGQLFLIILWPVSPYPEKFSNIYAFTL